MKAKELYAKHKTAILDADEGTSTAGVAALLNDLSDDMAALIKARHPKTNAATLACVNEINAKYNAVISCFEKEFGASPIKPDGFRQVWKQREPLLKRARDASDERRHLRQSQRFGQPTAVKEPDRRPEMLSQSPNGRVDMRHPHAIATLMMLGNMASGQ